MSANTFSFLSSVFFIKPHSVNLKIEETSIIFSGIFIPDTLSGTTLSIDSIEAVYFRKIYSLLSSSIQGIAINRIKDTLDLIQLDRSVKPLMDYVVEDFCEIWKQNVARKVTPLHILKSLKKLFFDVEEEKEKIEEILHKVYFTNITVGEILEWLRDQIERLSQL